MLIRHVKLSYLSSLNPSPTHLFHLIPFLNSTNAWGPPAFLWLLCAPALASENLSSASEFSHLKVLYLLPGAIPSGSDLDWTIMGGHGLRMRTESLLAC